MGSSFSGDDDLISDINITPFVDIILVVLIIFMVTTTKIAHSVKVNLPDAASGEQSQSTSLGLSLLADGSLLLDGQVVTAEALKGKLRSAKAENNEVVCLISAGKDVPHGRVIWLLDLVKSEGIAKFAFNINKVDAIGPDPGGSQGG